LGEIEIAMRKLLKFQINLHFYNKNFSQLELIYEKFKNEISDLYLRMLSQE